MNPFKYYLVLAIILSGVVNSMAQDTTHHPLPHRQGHPNPLPLTPQFPGGRDSLNLFVKKHARYPAEAKKHHIKGVIEVDFVVTKSGEITNPHVLKPLGYGCDKEALRVVKLMPKWKPGMMGRDPMEMNYHVNVPFGIDTTFTYH